MLQYLPYALGALGAYQGYQGARQGGASGLGRLLGAAGGALGGYQLGQVGGFAKEAGFTPYSQLGQRFPMLRNLPGQTGPAIIGTDKRGQAIYNRALREGGGDSKGSLMDMLFRREVDGKMVTDPLKVGGLTALGLYASGAFEPGPTDIYMPGYNMGVLDLQENRPGYSYIDPETGEEKAYEKMYLPEEAGRGQRRIGNLSFAQTRLKTGGLAEIKKFNEGGINYLPSKVSHDENDANNYVRASGYVEDGSGNGDKDEDTMLAQLADGEFVTRADGVLGAGIIAGANPNSMKDMREKGAKYFYEQQARYKRVFDLLKEKNGDSKQKTN